MKSIIQLNKNYCYICREQTGYIVERRGLEEHHIFGGPNRILSEKYGLKVYLCPEHHQFGPDAVHKNPNYGHDYYLKQIGQQAFTERYPDLDFRAIFGKSFI